jgi:signal transduction histidine kinase
MKLRGRLLVTALLIAVPVGIALFETNEWLRARDAELALTRFAASQMTDDFRERCESNPNWFIAGPREDRPSPEVLAAPDADATAPRPPNQELPVEYFAYDESFSPLSSAGPRFPTELKQALRSGSRTVTSPFPTSHGTGVQEGLLTGWARSPCVALLFRIRPIPNQARERLLIALGLVLTLAAVLLIAGGPTVWRVRRLGLEARQSASEEYRSSIDVRGRDEMSAFAFAFNEAAADIRRRASDVKDREESLRRYVTSTSDAVTQPLADLAQSLGRIDAAAVPGSARDAIRRAVIDAHTLAMRTANLNAAATLRMGNPPAKDIVELNETMRRLTAAIGGYARACDVTLVIKTGPIANVITDAAIFEQALRNLVDNAIRYNRAGGQAIVSLERTPDDRFSLRVTDDGPGAPDDVLAKLNANRRFRGDEGRTGARGDLGLGLAIVREVCDRSGIRWTFRRSGRGWFEVELTGPAH